MACSSINSSPTEIVQRKRLPHAVGAPSLVVRFIPTGNFSELNGSKIDETDLRTFRTCDPQFKSLTLEPTPQSAALKSPQFDVKCTSPRPADPRRKISRGLRTSPLREKNPRGVIMTLSQPKKDT